MPRTSKKSADKPAAKRSRKKTDKKLEEILEEAPIIGEQAQEKKYVEINAYDAATEKKKVVLWLVIGFLVFALAAFWLWILNNSLRAQKNELSTSESLSSIVDSITGDLAQAKQKVDELIEKVQENNAAQEVKDGVIDSLKSGLDITDWKTATSTSVNLAVKYPRSWNASEAGKSLIISSYDFSTGTPSVFAQVIISKKDNPQKISLSDWFDKEGSNKSDYYIDAAGLSIGGVPAIKYVKKDAAAGDINWLVYAMRANAVYQFDIVAPEGKDLYEQSVNNILKEIKFIK